VLGQDKNFMPQAYVGLDNGWRFWVVFHNVIGP